MDQYIALTHRGQHRETNEDAVLARALPDGWLLLAVADGVGGAQAGEVASRDAVRILQEQMTLNGALPPDRRLTEAIQHANRAIWRRQQGDDRLRGMSTTLVAALAHERRVWIANVGDSRGYVSEGRELVQVTDDHSFVADQVRSGEITEEEAWVSSARNIITRTVGSEEEVDVDVFGPIELTAGARVILTSDGVHDVVEPADLAVIALSGSLTQAAELVIEAANDRGGPDNISAVMCECETGPAGEKHDESEVAEPMSRYAIASITS